MDDIEYEMLVRNEMKPETPLPPIRSIDDWEDFPVQPTATTQSEPNDEPGIPNTATPDHLRHFIRVGLSIDQSQHTLSTSTPVTIRLKKGGSWERKLTLSGDISIKRRNGEIVVIHNGKSYYTASAIQIISSNPIEPITIDDEYSYRGHFEVRLNGSNLILINELNIEEYLRGVLPHEMGHRKEPHYEALKAQAISARTYTYKHLNSRSKYHFDLFADVRDQMYRGASSEYALSDQAVKETEGIVIQFSDTLIDSYYHSTCGGKTADIHEVWPNSEEIPYLKSVDDFDSNGSPWCSQSTYVTWSVSWNKNDLIKSCSNNLTSLNPSLNKFYSFDRLEIEDWTPSGRISALKITTDSGVHTVTSDKSRWVLRQPNSNKLLMSSRFKLYKSGSVYTAKGSGFGHGIGLCQMGAMSRSAAGQTYDQIIKAYYSGTELVRYQ